MSDGFTFFGLNIKRAEKEVAENPSATFALPIDDEGTSLVAAATNAAYYGVYVDINGLAKDTVQLIQKCREIALFPEVDIAIQDIINEAVPQEDDSALLTLNLDNLNFSDTLKDKIRNEFKTCLVLLKYNELASDIFRRWYIDGRLFYHIIVNKDNLRQGIIELRLIEATKIRKYKEVKKKKTETGVDVIDTITEFFVYNESGFAPQTASSGTQGTNQMAGVRLSTDAIVYVPSGFIDGNTTNVLSYLQKAIRPANQLRMLEDATVVYFIVRAPERRIFYIDVGNLPKLKAESYVKELIDKYRNKIVYDACLDMNTMIPLLDGRTLSLYEMQKEFEDGKEMWVYSVDPVTGEFAPGLVTSAGITKFDQKVVRITLDNGKTITCTLDHKFPVWNKGKVEAKDLVVGDSMIPHYTREQTLLKHNNSKYQQLFKNDTETWEFTHRAVSKWKDSVGIENEFVYEQNSEIKKTVHNKNFNRFDNSPNNLARMNRIDHINYHSSNSEQRLIALEIGRASLAEKLKDKEFNDSFRAAQRAGWTDEKKQVASDHMSRNKPYLKSLEVRDAMWKSEGFKENRTKQYETEYQDEVFKVVQECASHDMSIRKTAEHLNTECDLDHWREINKNKVGSQKDWSKFSREYVSRIAIQSGCPKWQDYKDRVIYNNHKIVSIEFLEETMDVGTLGIDKNEIYHDYHTFALDAGIYTCNSTGEVKNDKKYQAMTEDFFIPRRDGGKGTEITTLPGAQGIQGQLDSLGYFKKKLYESLNVPLSRLEPQQGFSLGRTGEISRDELKFQKFIDRLRRKFSQLFMDILKTQLILKGICNSDEWEALYQENIRIEFQRDNSFTELKEQELITSRLSLLPQVDQYLQKYFSKEWVQKNVLRMSDEDIDAMKRQMENEKDDPTARPSMMQDPNMMQPPGSDDTGGGLGQNPYEQDQQEEDADQNKAQDTPAPQ